MQQARAAAALPPAPSFAELLQLVRSGQEPPGVRRPQASPTGDSPAASCLPLPAKPWEKQPGSPAGAPPAPGAAPETDDLQPVLEGRRLSSQHPGGSSDFA
ncbi:uncharacterized protein C6orf226 homolog [Melanerpes formicivorus]|uniref:uncharacterized protein C6orf226 homolog n=1 Tax=Melanerpes formicivorus TaxID=211600 RepID=UPI00358ED506